MKFSYHKSANLPALAWLAILTKDTDRIELFCGSEVVTTDLWFAAGVWDGQLAEGGMDSCIACCCSGLKLHEGG